MERPAPGRAFGRRVRPASQGPAGPTGQKVLSGGGASIADEQLAASSPTADRRALCAPTGKAVTASAPARRRAERQVAVLAARIEAQVQP